MVPRRRNGPLFYRRRRNVFDDEVEERAHAGVLRTFGALRHPAFLGRAVEDGKVELLIGRVEGGEEIEDLVHDLGGPRIGAVDLVDDDDGLEAHLQGLGDDEFRLRQRPLGGVDENKRAVNHMQDALDLAAEIGVARRVDDIDARVVPDDRGRFGKDGDAALALEVV